MISRETSIYGGFSVAMLNNQMVIHKRREECEEIVYSLKCIVIIRKLRHSEEHENTGLFQPKIRLSEDVYRTS